MIQHRRHQTRLPPNIAPAIFFQTPIAAPVEPAGAPINGPVAPPPETGVNADLPPARYQPVLQTAPVQNLVYQTAPAAGTSTGRAIPHTAGTFQQSIGQYLGRYK